MFKRSIKIICFVLVSSFSLLAIGYQTKPSATGKQIENFSTYVQNNHEVKNLFYNVPSPIEVTEIIKRMKLPYQPDLMNPVANAENYLSQADMAINVGVYGADLSYIRIYEQFQDAARYLSVIKKFTRELGIPEDQEQYASQRIAQNIENQDSLLNIISETFTKSDSYLKENRRGGTAALIVCGGWIETLYLATNLIDLEHPHKEMIALISQQKHSVKNLIGLLDQYSSNEKISQILPDLKTLDAKFQEITQEKSVPTRIKTKDGKTVIQNKLTLIASNKIILEIKTINDRIREMLTEL